MSVGIQWQENYENESLISPILIEWSESQSEQDAALDLACSLRDKGSSNCGEVELKESCEVVFTQPYVPAYRVALFEALEERLLELGATLKVYASAPDGRQAARGDAVEARWIRTLVSRTIRVGSRQVKLRHLPFAASHAAVVVTELEVGNALAWCRLLSGRPTILWGHGAPYTTRPSKLGDMLKARMAGLADHTFTYTEGGRKYLLDLGVDSTKVTAVGNSTDTHLLRQAVIESRASKEEDSRSPSALFVGGLDETKRIDFLLQAAREAKKIDHNFVLTVVGRGVMGQRVSVAETETGAVHLIAEARGRELAEIAARADMIWMPGRVGLVAVDAIALGLPVHTVWHDSHAPELEFLGEKEVAFLPDNPRDFARESLARSGQLPLRDDYPTIEGVVRQMVRIISPVAGINGDHVATRDGKR